MGKLSYSPTQRELVRVSDPCPICKNELYYNGKKTQRIGLLDEFESLDGWMCPHCKSEYDLDGKIINLSGTTNISGEA